MSREVQQFIEASKVADEMPLTLRSLGLGVVLALVCYWTGDREAALTCLVLVAGCAFLFDWSVRSRMSKARMADIMARKNPNP